MLNYTDLAKEINKAIAAKDKDGNLSPVTPEQEAYAKAVLTIILASTTHSPGTVTGTTAAGAPLVAGQATNGILVGLTPSAWLAELQSGFPTADPSQLASEASKSTTFLLSNTKINFLPGNITGTCTSTGTNPGPLVAGAGQNGTIDNLDGQSWSSQIIPSDGDPALAAKIYKAIVKYLHTTAKVSYPTGTVVGTCPTASGPLTAGAASGGIIA